MSVKSVSVLDIYSPQKLMIDRNRSVRSRRRKFKEIKPRNNDSQMYVTLCVLDYLVMKQDRVATHIQLQQCCADVERVSAILSRHHNLAINP